MAQVRTERFPLMLSPKEVEAIEGYRWNQKIESRAEAVRRLIAKGLDAEKSEGPVAPTTSPSE